MPDVQDIVAEILRDDEYVLGSFGDTGPQGEKGDAATITIGSVITGTPQTPASVTNSGTQYDAVLNFVIPKGDTGSVESTTDPLQINTVRCATIKSYTTGENVCIFAQDLTTFGNATCPTKIIGSSLKASEDGNTFYDIITSKTAYTPNLLSFIWSDHLLNDQRWLRADTFSWQSGETYSSVYQHLLDDIGVSRYFIPNDGFDTKFYRNSENDTTMFAWSAVGATLYTENEFPNVGDNFYYQGAIAGTVGSTGVEWLSYIKTLLGGNKHYPRKSSADSGGMYAWEVNASTVYYTNSPTPQVGDDVYLGSGVLTTVSEFVGVTPQTETIGSYTITYYPATDGHKVVLADQETAASNIYSESGIAWYYVLDIVNTRFKLPRTQYAFTGLRNTVGKYVEESLPNITGEVISESGYAVGAFYDSGILNGGRYKDNNKDRIVYFDASRSSSTYQNGAPVQQRSTQMYLYFYVGQFTQTATEQTAGLNTELFNGKLDRDFSNKPSNIHYIVETYHNGTDWYRVWSDGWCEQGGELGWTSSAWANGTRVLIKPFRDTTYNLFVLGNWSDSESSSCTVSDKTTTDFTVRYAINTAIQKGCWYACGYIS